MRASMPQALLFVFWFEVLLFAAAALKQTAPVKSTGKRGVSFIFERGYATMPQNWGKAKRSFHRSVCREIYYILRTYGAAGQMEGVVDRVWFFCDLFGRPSFLLRLASEQGAGI